jgi:hypothetical protein
VYVLEYCHTMTMVPRLRVVYVVEYGRTYSRRHLSMQRRRPSWTTLVRPWAPAPRVTVHLLYFVLAELNHELCLDAGHGVGRKQRRLCCLQGYFCCSCQGRRRWALYRPVGVGAACQTTEAPELCCAPQSVCVHSASAQSEALPAHLRGDGVVLRSAPGRATKVYDLRRRFSSTGGCAE